MWFKRFTMLALTALATGCATQSSGLGRQNAIGVGQRGGVDANGQAQSLSDYTGEVTDRLRLTRRLLAEAEMMRRSGRDDEARQRYRQVQEIDLANPSARNGLAQLERQARHRDWLKKAQQALVDGDLGAARSLIDRVALEDSRAEGVGALRQKLTDEEQRLFPREPEGLAAIETPINLDFKDASILVVIEALSRATGMSFVFDPDFKSDTRATIMLKNARVQDAFELLARTHKLAVKALNEKTVLIYPATPEKSKEYDELKVRSFYLANANARSVQESLKTLLGVENVVVDERLNMLLIRDTLERVDMVARLVALHDIPDAEVMLDVEVLEVSRSKLEELGLRFPDQLTLTPLPRSGGSSTGTTLDDLKHLRDESIGASLGSLTINLRKELGDANVLANPRIRAKNKEQAKILIGDRVPLITTTTTATGFASENIEYLDVGLKLDVTPTIFVGDEVSIKVGLEVSSLGQLVQGSAGALAYQIGTRNASTTLRLRDGETQILAGLISDEDRFSANKLPGLGDVPLLGRLFSNERNDGNASEIVLSITPRIIRPLSLPAPRDAMFWSGTGAHPGAPLLLKSADQSVSHRDLGLAGTGRSAPLPVDSQAEEAPKNARQNVESSTDLTPATSLSLTWGRPINIANSDDWIVPLLALTDGGVRSVPVQIDYDAKNIEIRSVSAGVFLDSKAASARLVQQVDQEKGQIFVSVSSGGTSSVASEGTLLNITFRKKSQAAGESAFTIVKATGVSLDRRSLNVSLPQSLSLP